jgi:hypothetical protein
MISSLKTLAFRQAKVADQQPPRYMGEKPRLPKSHAPEGSILDAKRGSQLDAN